MNPHNHKPYIHPAGWPFIAGFAVLALILSMASAAWFLFGLILLGWCVYFFRNPRRVTPVREGLIISPADGRVIAIADVKPDADLGLGDETRTRISVFLNVFDVHVNRAPIGGTVTHVHYRPGKFVNASLDKASVDNERTAIALEIDGSHSASGQKIGFVQIAGLIARRIVCSAKVGDKLQTGQRYGLIRFGSRTDIYLPRGVQPMVIIGQRVLGGETVLADCQSTEAARAGEIR